MAERRHRTTELLDAYRRHGSPSPERLEEIRRSVCAPAARFRILEPRVGSRRQAAVVQPEPRRWRGYALGAVLVGVAAILTLWWLSGPTMVLGRSTAEPQAAPYEAEQAETAAPVLASEPPHADAPPRRPDAMVAEPIDGSAHAPQPAATTSRPRPTREPPPPEDPLLAEMRLIEQAEVFLRQERPARALELLTEHERTFVDGELAVERQVLRVIALCSLGKHAQGRGEAALLERRGLSAPYEERIDRACERSAENRDAP